MRERGTVERALTEARESYARLSQGAFKLANRSDLLAAVQAQHLALTQIALLEALLDYVQRGGGSRGSYMVMSEKGTVTKSDLICPWTQSPYSFIAENEKFRQHIAEIELADAERAAFHITQVSPCAAPQRDVAFERMWGRFRERGIFQD